MLRGRKDVVVVGVAAGDDEGGLAYAVAEVGRRGGGSIHVVHVVAPLASGGVPVPMVMEGDTLRLAGARVVGDAARRLEHVLDDIAITTELAHGPVVPGLVRASRHARLVVVQHQRRRGRHRAPSLSVSNGVAAHAHVPVVVVPAGWQPAPERDHTVVAGLDAPATAPGVLRTALDEAVARRGSLRVVQVWRDGDLYADRGNEGDARRAYEELRRDLEREIALMLADDAGVPVEVVVEHARAARVLVDASGTADVLVVGRHHPSVPWGAHLGSTVRAVLRDSASPVLVVDPSPGSRGDS